MVGADRETWLIRTLPYAIIAQKPQQCTSKITINAARLTRHTNT